MIKKSKTFNGENRLGFNSLKTTKPLQGDRLLTVKSLEFLVLIRLTSVGRKAELTSEPQYLYFYGLNDFAVGYCRTNSKVPNLRSPSQVSKTSISLLLTIW